MGAQGKVRRLVYAIASSVLALPCAHGRSSDVCDHKDAQNCRNRRCTVVASGEWWTPNHALVQVSRPLAAWRVRRPVVGVLPVLSQLVVFFLFGAAAPGSCHSDASISSFVPLHTGRSAPFAVSSACCAWCGCPA